MIEWIKNDKKGFAIGCGAIAKKQFPELQGIEIDWEHVSELPNQLDKYFDRVESPRDCDLILVAMPIYIYHILTIHKYPYFNSLTAFGASKQHINKYSKFKKICYKRRM